MAEGYARATGRPALVNLHAASGSGNAMGALTNAHYGHIPMVILAGQQVRRTVGQETMLASADASMLPAPLVKYFARAAGRRGRAAHALAGGVRDLRPAARAGLRFGPAR